MLKAIYFVPKHLDFEKQDLLLAFCKYISDACLDSKVMFNPRQNKNNRLSIVILGRSPAEAARLRFDK
jgi:hypothetical protein